MKITFLGTRGNIDVRKRSHYYHACTLISYKNTHVMIDRGFDWLGKKYDPVPDGIIITHGHPDHVDGLKEGAPCPVYATKESWEIMKNFAIETKKTIKPQKTFSIKEISITPFFVEHSIRAPAVGYRIKAGTVTIFCVHDLVAITEREKALKNSALYIGDGATINRPLIRRKNDTFFGHTTIKTQLNWCEKENVPRAIFTHCGTQIVGSDGRVVNPRIEKMGEERNVKTQIAHDGMKIILS